MHRGHEIDTWLHTSTIAVSFGGGDPLDIHPYGASLKLAQLEARERESVSREDVRAFIGGFGGVK